MSGLVNVGEMGALALHLMVELAVLNHADPEARLTVQQLAARLNASSNTLAKVARRLVMLGMAEGMRGASGGLRATVDPGATSMLSVIEAVEGKKTSNGCLFAKRVCPQGGCAFDGVTGELERTIHDYLSKTTLADLAGIGAAEKTR